MTSPHMDISILRRARGHSAVAAAAYGAGERLYDQRIKQFHKWDHRTDVVHTEIMGPADMPAYLYDRETLWNKAEELEQRKDSALARRVILALPHELSHAERVELVRGYVAEHFVSQGMVADIALHKPDLAKGQDHRNHHTHILLTLRKAGPDGLYRTKTREWNARRLPYTWRAGWAEYQTRALQRAGHNIVLNPRTLKPLDRVKENFPPSLRMTVKPGLHLGRDAKINSPKWLEQDKILAANVSKAAAARRKTDARRKRLADKKEKLYRRLAQLKNFPGADLFGESRKYEDKRSMFHIEGRIRFVLSIDDMLFEWQVWVHGWETAVRLQRERFRDRYEKKRKKEKQKYLEQQRSRERSRF